MKKSFLPDFRRETQELIEKGKISISTIVQTIGVSQGTAYNWKLGKKSPSRKNFERLKQLASGGQQDQIVEDSELYPLPIVGAVPAGNPTDFTEEILGHFPFPKLMLGSNYKKSYVLKVEGQSMAPTVNDGDMVVVVPFREPVSGEMVIARVDGGYTLKKCTGKKDELKALNPEHKNVVAKEEIEILGVVKWIVKKP